ncbi:GntR family transcriptional regulator [Puniceibacterium sp. IMCC21224]|uniref:GntR family transcriptional regulator n=1 Tax=Puniceibacterium sp. IMCC21224 TaxID=1618204 RepID=UPI00064D8B87|nr:GntR family transcriptional regulator [Puniceibacterium sp. IMCC21224]KMK67363.1 transcriptional regulator, GntR family [Puniceibacterium sp. IMCC21224]
MALVRQAGARETSVDLVFNHLSEQIASLRLLPGDKISEAEIAAEFGVSRQPVRDAFNRLVSLDLLVSRPQRATEVKRISLREIAKSRFVRAAVEARVLGQAAMECDAKDVAILNASLERQRKTVQDNDFAAFGVLDYQFHEALCGIAKADFAFEIISAEKAKVDRLCMLGLAKGDRMPVLLSDHEAIAAAVERGDADAAVEAGMLHLSRLDGTIETVSKINARYFDP